MIGGLYVFDQNQFMIEHKKESFYLELAEIIKVNQLVRDRIDFRGFEEWYEALSIPQQIALINTLFDFAYEAGVSENIWNESLPLTNFQNENELVVQLKLFHNDEIHTHSWSDYKRWIKELTDTERFNVFKIAIYLFGTAEGRVFKSESKTYCNHWWHRDLLNTRVVESILNDSSYYATSMRDDDRVISSDEINSNSSNPLSAIFNYLKKILLNSK
jgi:Family of unknown function (DUF5958)